MNTKELKMFRTSKDCPTLFISCMSDTPVSIFYFHLHGTDLLKNI